MLAERFAALEFSETLAATKLGNQRIAKS